ncbi:MAG: hypothetical protein FWC03_12950, partial [Treponema sp.]|nr:hypothetical protein [Treponema sp.]
MNTIPSIFNERIPTYTAVGGRERSSCGISAVILNRHGFPRRSFFQELEKTGFDNVISVESRAPNYNIEDLARRYPFIRFILPENEISLGEQINIAASEIDNPLFFVMRSDMKIIAGGYAGRMAERLSVKADIEEKNEHTEKDDKADAASDKKTVYKRLCTVPVIINSNYEALRSLVIPMTYKKKMRTIFMEPQKEGDLTLYPFEGIGIYDRRRFIGIGGFDTTLRHIHWQLMDFGFRAHLWGEEIALNLQVKLLYDGEIPGVDYSVDTYYRHFY